MAALQSRYGDVARNEKGARSKDGKNTVAKSGFSVQRRHYEYIGVGIFPYRWYRYSLQFMDTSGTGRDWMKSLREAT